MEKDINKIIIGEDTYNLRDKSVQDWARGDAPTLSSLGAVPTSRKINGKSLTSDITLTAENVGALPNTTVIPQIAYVRNESSMPETPVEVVLYLIGEEVVNIIGFTIAGNTYQAEEGMTWGEWVESAYNVYGFSIYNQNTRAAERYPDNAIQYYDQGCVWDYEAASFVTAQSVILAKTYLVTLSK